MKKSRYNIFAHWESFDIGINLISGKMMVFRQNEYKQFIKTNPNELEILNKPLFKNIIDAGFIIDDYIDEFSVLLHRYYNDVFYNNNSFKLTILPTLSCNFKCWYCYEKHPHSVMSPEVCKKTMLYVDYIFEHTPLYGFNLDWFGGEPLLYFNQVVYPLSLYVKKKAILKNINFTNTITTNGFLINDKMIKQFSEIELNGFQITLDGYKDIHDNVRFPSKNQGSYDTIIKNINKICLSLSNANISLRINYTNATINNLSKIIEDLDPGCYNKIHINLQRVWQTIANENNSDIEDALEDEIDIFSQKGIAVTHDNFIYGKGCKCYADSVRQSVVNYDGTLFKCTARDFSNTKHAVGYLDKNGEPKWNDNYYKHFVKAPFDNPTCRKCKYVPVCLGVCSQKYVEEGESFLKNHCDKKSCLATIENDLYISLYKYLKDQINQNKSI